MFGLFALFVCIALIVSLSESTYNLQSDQDNTHYAIDANAKLSMDSLINVVVITMCKFHQNGSNID